jgi:Protein of unknown function (DUF4229)
MRAGSVTPVSLTRDLTLYTLARIGLVAVVAVLLTLFNVPLLVAVAVGVVAGLPLGILLFRPLNRRVTEGLAARGAEREEHRARLRAQLRGEDPPDAS